LRRALALTLAVALVPAAGCGGGGGRSAPSSDQQQRATGPFLTADQLERQLAAGFRDGLYRLAVMTQQSDDAVDLGQDLPTGLVERVSCEPAGARGAKAWPWRCEVRWRDVERHGQRTRYEVRLMPGGCFGAGAIPRRPQVYDATIRAYGEDPLNGIVAVKTGC
jgi:hypothetical protein